MRWLLHARRRRRPLKNCLRRQNSRQFSCNALSRRRVDISNRTGRRPARRKRHTLRYAPIFHRDRRGFLLGGTGHDQASGGDPARRRMKRARFAPLAAGLALAGCMVGPDYIPPPVLAPERFKELKGNLVKGWKLAAPRDRVDAGPGWARRSRRGASECRAPAPRPPSSPSPESCVWGSPARR